MSQPTLQDIASMTPMMQQYYELKSKVPDAIMFFRMGDFYEIFGDEAEEIAPLLDIALTSRERGDAKVIKFCGVPHHSAQAYWLRLLKLNYKIAIADQTEDAAQAKGLVKRDIVRVISPGCIDELEGLKSDAPNYVAAIHEDPTSKAWALCLADTSTGELRLGKVNSYAEVIQHIERLKPKEILVRKFFLETFQKTLHASASMEKIFFSPLNENILRDENDQETLLIEVFGKEIFTSEIQESFIHGGGAVVAALLAHLKGMFASIRQFRVLRPLYDLDRMLLQDHVIRDLELFQTVRHNKTEGSLFNIINHCLSPMGSRLLRWSLVHPLIDGKKINLRHAMVADLVGLGDDQLSLLRAHLKGMGDLERLMTRVLARNIRPQELARLKEALKKVELLSEFFHSQCSRFSESFQLRFQQFRKHRSALTILSAALQDAPLGLGLGDGVFLPAFDQLLDQKNASSKSGQDKVDAYQELLRQETKISSLKIKQNNTFGLLIEITKTHLTKVPQTFIRRQTMVNCERYTTPELKDLEDELASAKELSITREQQLFQELLDQLANEVDPLQVVSFGLAEVDMLQSFAWLALNHRYVRPSLSLQNLKLEAARHPAVERHVGSHHYTANHISLNRSKSQMLITGPNMGGKSTVMRMVAVSAILNQMGCYVPALKAELPLFDQIFTRVGASDDLSSGLSTFMVEMSETAHILRHASEHSLVILDEVGRGTSSEDGLALAAAILEDIAQQLHCWTLFATHYHELVEFSASLSSVEIFQTEVIPQGEDIRFTHRLIPGASGSSYGIDVARLAGIPSPVVARAKKLMESHCQSKSDSKLETKQAFSLEPTQELVRLSRSLVKESEKISLSAMESIVQTLEKIAIHRLTPLQALNILNELKESLHRPAAECLFEDGQMLL